MNFQATIRRRHPRFNEKTTMSTSSNPLLATPGIITPPGTSGTFQDAESQGAQPKKMGFFGKLGTVVAQHMPEIQESLAHLAAVGGNYGPLQELQTQQEFGLRRQLAQSQLDNQSLNRQLLQRQLDNSRSPEEMEALKPPTQFTGLDENNQPILYQRSFNPTTRSFENKPATYQAQVENPAYAASNAMSAAVQNTKPSPLTLPPVGPLTMDQEMGARVPIAPAMPSTSSPTISQQRTIPAGPQYGFNVKGYDADGNPIVATYSKSGQPIGSAAAPTPNSIANPSSAWQAYLQTGRKQGLSDAQIIDQYNSTESTRSGVRMVPQLDGTIAAVPVTEGSTNRRHGALSGGAAPAQGSPASNASPQASVGGPGRTVGGRTPKPVTDAFNTYNSSLERYSIMQDALPDALKGDQQAQLNLLANHVGMTLGLQKGARITQALINEAIKSAPWLQGIQARFDSRGYLSGVALTPEQMQSMVSLAKNRADNDAKAYQRVQDEARRGFGVGGPATNGSNSAAPPVTLPPVPGQPNPKNPLGI